VPNTKIEEVIYKISRAASKATSKKRQLPALVKRKVKDTARPYIRRTKKLGVKINYAAKLASSGRERDIYVKVRSARLYDRDKQWSQSIVSWRAIIAEYGRDAPAEAYVRLSWAFAHSDDYAAAATTIDEAMNAETQLGGDELTKSHLQELLRFSKTKAEISITARSTNIDEYVSRIKSYNIAKHSRAKHSKIAIVSAIAGGYDAIRPPEIIDERFDYIVYTDAPVRNPGFYDVRPLPYIDADNTRSARFVKTNLTKLLPEYDYIVWIDANIFITGDIFSIVKDFMASGKEFGAMLHPTRTSPYDEMEECLRTGKDDADAIIDQRNYYHKQGYTTDKLIESNVLMVNTRGKHIDDFMGMWWNHIDRFSRRDQFSINYCLDANEVDWMTFTERPITARNHPIFALVDHGQGNNSFKRFMHQLAPDMTDPFLALSNTTLPSKAKTKPMSVTAVVCVHNAREDVELCLESIKRHKTPNQDLIIIDDGSDTPTADYLNTFQQANAKWAKLVRHDKAKGYTRAASRGLKESTADLTVLLNSDTIVTNGWANKMAAVVQQNKGVGIVGPMSSAASTQSLPDHASTKDQTAINALPPGLGVDDMNEFCEKASLNGQAVRVPLIHGFCFGVTREVIETIGLLDHENFPRGYGEENDYCFRAADAGFSLAVATDTYIFHAKSKSFVSDERKKLMQDGGRAFRDKHGQRRITRAVNTMRQNPYLVRMRSQAEKLYVKQIMNEMEPASGEKIVKIPASYTDATMTFEEKSSALSALNDELIEWQTLRRKRYSKGKVSIIVLVYGQLEMTTRCIESIVNAKNKTKSELLVVHNGSDIKTTLGLRELKNRFPDMSLIQIEQNLNFALGNNVGFSFATGEKSVFLNNDTYVTDGWLDGLVEALEGDVRVAQPLLLYPDETVQSLGVAFSPMGTLAHALYANRRKNDSRAVRSHKLQAVTGACMAIASKDFAALKGFDPIFVNGQEDVDLCLRLAEYAGKTPIGFCTVDSIVYHDESKTPGRGTYMMNNRRIFVQRWNDKTIADTDLYANDKFSIEAWEPDTRDAELEGLAIYRPRLK